MPFCICWANATWSRSWGKINGTPWALKYEPKKLDGDRATLMEQDYGTESQWIEHFEYLLQFFKDDRYIKKDGKPVFVIYDTNLIDCLDEMLICWRKLAKKNDIEDLYVIGAGANRGNLHCLDGVLKDHPRTMRARLNSSSDLTNGLNRVSYDVAWEQILLDRQEDVRTYYCGLVGFDETPRQAQKGLIVEGSTPDKFKDNLKKLFVKSEKQGNDLLFINAWNEWGEGMHLEPDQRWEYGFLEALRDAKATYNTDDTNNLMDFKVVNKEISMYKTMYDKSEYNLQVMHKWLWLREKGIYFEDYLKKKNVQSIAIYGFGILSEHLVWELEKAEVEVKYVIDRKGNNLQTDFKVYTLEDDLPEVDMVIVAIPYYFNELIKELKNKNIKNIVSLDLLITELQNKLMRVM